MRGAGALKSPRTHWRDRRAERLHRLRGHLCEAWTTPWTAGNYRAASEPCTALYQLVVNGKLKLCVKHARIEVLALVVQGKQVRVRVVSRGRNLATGILRSPGRE